MGHNPIRIGARLSLSVSGGGSVRAVVARAGHAQNKRKPARSQSNRDRLLTKLGAANDILESMDSRRIHFDDSIRHELVARVRGEIALGTYDTSEKVDLVFGNPAFLNAVMTTGLLAPAARQEKKCVECGSRMVMNHVCCTCGANQDRLVNC